MVERIILLTDGFTIFPEACERLAREAATRGIAITTIGLGGEFQSELLTKIADLTGGRALLPGGVRGQPRPRDAGVSPVRRRS